MTIKLSILDQSPVFEGETPADAFNHTVELVQQAERLGYHRFWVSEHHDGFLAGSSPEVLLAYLVGKTERIRLGSGGVMLQHYSPYKVAENFNILATLAPGRIDLGIGRAPGGLPRSTQALQKGITEPLSLGEKLEELGHHVNNTLPDTHPLAGIQASPIPEQPAGIFLLGTSVSSAELAAEQGLSYVFAQFINSDPAVAHEALTVYRERFNRSNGAASKAIVALSVIVSDTDEEASTLASGMKNVRITLADGKTLNLGTVAQAEEYGKQSGQSYTIVERDAEVTHGSKETVRRRLQEIGQQYEVDEFIVTTPVKDFSQRLRSYELLSEAFSELSVGS
ncbi:LLM class flavin-dependent oxidoreductase [Paenibacillus sp. NEAU-GSW1]|uniref:LLM class flavin-dependent oxidoreductase n=1 Tax=Paenibacillus sp. NEAU-GSW1 TaxID=2682486 RepID=UPI0012E31B9E|nr:LLM class flavin-dependent oxidoreductase [Paenibacillus sp. NEAU-GSW1]MUT67200.1 MsnO8 family LLM class oxidoreductase [Paenibacillus sp. NEAU-GSW1]